MLVKCEVGRPLPTTARRLERRAHKHSATAEDKAPDARAYSWWVDVVGGKNPYKMMHLSFFFFVVVVLSFWSLKTALTASSKTVGKLSWFLAEHSKYFAAPISLASFSPWCLRQHLLCLARVVWSCCCVPRRWQPASGCFP